MIYKEAIKKLKNHNLIVTVGNEPFYRDQVLNKVMLDNPDHEVVRFDCEDTESNNILSAIRFKDLFNTPRIFHIRNFLKLKKLSFFIEKKFKDKIILDSEREGKSKEYKALLKKSLYIECKKPTPWNEESDFMGKAIGYLKSQGYSMSKDTAEYLFHQLGYNLYRLMRELQKIMMYKDNPSEITPRDIDSICLKGLHYNVFDIVDCIIDNKKAKALDLLEKTFKYETTPGILLISLWYDHFESLLFIKSSTEEEALKYVKMPPILIKRKLMPQSYKISTKKLVTGLNYLAQTDYNLRRGSYDLKYFLEKFIYTF